MAVRDIAAIRQELATAPLPTGEAARTELATLVRMGGTWRRSGGPVPSTSVVVTSPVGAVVRRVTRLCDELDLPRPTLAMRAPGGVRSVTTWAARLDASTLAGLGATTPEGRPATALPDWLPAPDAALRAVLLVATSVSAPRSAAHLEVALPSNALARDLAALFAHHGVALHHDPDRARMVAKAGPAIVAVLEAAGAPDAAADHVEHQHRRDTRSTAVALTNADHANLRRAVAAAHDQIADLSRLRRAAGWATVPRPLQEVALARLANPTATLAELGQLCDPPVGKSTVHRRMAQLRDLAARIDDDGMVG